MSEQNSYKLKAFTVKNVLRVKFAHIDFENGKAVVTGDHGSGKTSLARAFMMTLLGKREVPEEPVHHGAEFGVTFLELDEDFNIRMTVHPDRSYRIELLDKDGGRYSDARERLDAFNAHYGFYPEEFITMPDKDRTNFMLKLTGTDLDAFNRKRKTFFDDRTQVNRDLTKVVAQLEGLPFYDDAPMSEISAKELSEEFSKAHEWHLNKDKLVQQALVHDNEASKARAEVERLLKQVDLYKERADKEEEAARNARSVAEGMQLPDLEAIKTRLNSAEDTNRKVRANIERGKHIQAREALEKQAKDLTGKIEALDAEKEKIVQSLTLPNSGLRFDENGCKLGNVPFDQGSDKDKWEAAIEVGVMLKPKLKFIYVRHGGLLTAKAREDIFKIAEAKGFQVLYEVPGEAEDATIIMEDGVSHEPIVKRKTVVLEGETENENETDNTVHASA